MKRILTTVVVLVLAAMPALAADEENEWRTWTSTAGTRIEARLVERGTGTVVLERKEGGKRLTVKLSQLSAADREFVAAIPEEPEEKGETALGDLDAKPGETSEEIKCTKDDRWSYFLYLPKEFHTGRKWPVWFIMSPGGGGGGGGLNRYKTGADRLGCILALSVQSKNNFGDSEEAIETMADDVYERLPVIEGLGFTTGFSGGSRMAYLLAERDKRIDGVLACGSGGGVYQKKEAFRAAKLRKTTYVHSLIGTNCFNRTEASRSHNTFPDDYRLRFFPGGHAWAGSPYIEEGMARVLGEALAQSRDRELEKLRRDYARTMWTWTREMKADQPWEAAFWAEFLAKFEGDPEVNDQARELAGELEDNPQVELAADAEKAIAKFCKKYYNRADDLKGGNKPDPAREAEADKVADEFGDLPHAELIRKLGKKS